MNNEIELIVKSIYAEANRRFFELKEDLTKDELHIISKLVCQLKFEIISYKKALINKVESYIFENAYDNIIDTDSEERLKTLIDKISKIHECVAIILVIKIQAIQDSEASIDENKLFDYMFGTLNDRVGGEVMCIIDSILKNIISTQDRYIKQHDKVDSPDLLKILDYTNLENWLVCVQNITDTCPLALAKKRIEERGVFEAEYLSEEIQMNIMEICVEELEAGIIRNRLINKLCYKGSKYNKQTWKSSENMLKSIRDTKSVAVLLMGPDPYRMCIELHDKQIICGTNIFYVEVPLENATRRHGVKEHYIHNCTTNAFERHR